jgi:hypothetical protein
MRQVRWTENYGFAPGFLLGTNSLQIPCHQISAETVEMRTDGVFFGEATLAFVSPFVPVSIFQVCKHLKNRDY